MGQILASRADVARLYGRVAFGATTVDLAAWTGKRYVDVVENLLMAPTPGTVPLDRVPAQLGSVSEPLTGQMWWLNQMLTTPFPLEERMTLLWHNHFATAAGKARGDLVVAQNQTLRTHALGSFRDLLVAVTLDPAMLQWLDGAMNVVGKANENFARECFELFTLGRRPQVYTETDIREAARAFTGWELSGAAQAQYQEAKHDPRTKTILGRTITNQSANEYKAVLDAALAQPSAATFVARRIVQNLAYEVAPDPATDPLVTLVAGQLRTSNWNIRTAVRAMLLSDLFRNADPTQGRQVVRQPIELAIHAAKAVGLPRIDDTTIPAELRAAGQVPFEPPNVGGWLLGPRWLGPSTYLGNYAVSARMQAWRNVLVPARLRTTPPSADIGAGGAAWAAQMGLAALSPTTLAACQAFVASGAGGTEEQLQDGIFILIANSPDWQVM